MGKFHKIFFFEFNEIKAIFRIRWDFRSHNLAFTGKYIVGEQGPLTSMLWNVSKIKLYPEITDQRNVLEYIFFKYIPSACKSDFPVEWTWEKNKGGKPLGWQRMKVRKWSKETGDLNVTLFSKYTVTSIFR
jgi:hypothetical protein